MRFLDVSGMLKTMQIPMLFQHKVQTSLQIHAKTMVFDMGCTKRGNLQCLELGVGIVSACLFLVFLSGCLHETL